jgi:prophage regulatory protein
MAGDRARSLDLNVAFEQPGNTRMSRKGESISERFPRLAEVQRRFPYCRSSIYLKFSRGEFPTSINLGARAVAWIESDVDEWIESRIAKSRDIAPVVPAWASHKDHAQESS